MERFFKEDIKQVLEASVIQYCKHEKVYTSVA